MFGKKSKKNANEKEVAAVREYFELFSETLIYVFFVMTFLLQSFVIPTGSMKNNILVGDHLLVNKVAYSRPGNTVDHIVFPQSKIARGSIVTFKAPAEMEKEYVKRVIALPGEMIRIIDKNVYINGKLLNEPYTRFEDGKTFTNKPGDNFPLQSAEYADVLGKISHLPFYINDENGFVDQKRSREFRERFEDSVIKLKDGYVFKVPEGHYFCMGDNRDRSYDSRFWGPVPEEFIIGKPWRIYWSFDATTDEYLNQDPRHKFTDIFKTIINFIPKTRWDRTIKKVE